MKYRIQITILSSSTGTQTLLITTQNITVNHSYFTEFPHFVGQNDEKIQKPKKLAYTRYNTPNRFPDHETTISNPHHSEV